MTRHNCITVTGKLLVFVALQLAPACLFCQGNATALPDVKGPRLTPGGLQTYAMLTAPQLEQHWKTFAQDKGWNVLQEEMKKKGYARTSGEKSQWGFQGKSDDKQPVMVCLFDFQSKAKENCSLVWYKYGTHTYKAYILLPKSYETIDEALENSTEYYVGDDTQLKKAHSFAKCLKRRIKDQCSARCLASAVGCTLVPTIAGYMTCVAAICGSCVVFSAIACGD